jgi:hypothetical protein
MPISLDNAFAGAIGREFGAGPSMADQFDRLSRALERRRDPLTRIGLDTFDAIRDMAAAIRQPPWYILAVRVVNLGFLELMAGGSFVFLVLIYLKLDQIWRRLWSLKFELQLVNAHFDILNTQLDLVILMLKPLAAMERALMLVLGYLSLISQTLIAMFGAFSRGMLMMLDMMIEHVYKVDLDLGPIDLAQLLIDLAALAALLGAVAIAGGPAALALSLFAGAAALAAGALGLVSAALNSMPDNAAELIKWVGALGAAILAFLIVTALIGMSGKGLVGMIVGVVGALLLLFGIAGALQLMPENIEKIVPPLMQLIGALGALTIVLALIKPDRIWHVIGGLLALGVFLLLTAAAMRIFDETAIQAMQSMPAFFDALNSLAENIVSQADNFETIAKGLAGIVVFVGLLGLALRVFPDDAAPALEAMASVIGQLTALADKIVEIATGGHMESVAYGLLGIIVFVAGLGVALMLFDEQAIQASYGIAAVANAFAALASALAAIDPANFWTIVGLLAALAATTLAVGIAASIGGPHLSGLAAVLREMSNLLNTVATSANSLAEALRSLPSISLPSLPSLPGMAMGGPVNSTGPYLLHEGEYVLNPAQTSAMRAGGGGGGAVADNSVSVGAVNVTVSAQSVDQDSIPALGDEIVRQIGARLSELGREDAFAQGVRTEAG